MKFFDYRFRQFVVVDSREIEEYYREKFLPELAMKAIGKQPVSRRGRRENPSYPGGREIESADR